MANSIAYSNIYSSLKDTESDTQQKKRLHVR